MKRTILIAMAVFPAMLFAQNGAFTVKGKVGKYNAPAKVFLLYSTNPETQVTDSAILKDGSFSFKGSVSEPVTGVLVLDNKGVGLQNVRPESQPDVLRFYIEKGDVTVSGTDSLSKATVTGKTNAENKKLSAQLKPVENKLSALNGEYNAASPENKQSEQFMTALRGRYETLMQEQNTILKKFIQDNPSSYVSLTALRTVAGQSPNPAEIESLINTLSPSLKSSPSLKPLIQNMEALKKTSVGSQAMDFTQNDPDGKPVKLSDFKGKYVLLDFWASWCGPCRQENPNVVSAFNKYKDKNFTVLGVSLDRQNGKDAWLKAIKDDGLTWTHVSDLKFWQNEVAVMYGVRGIPKNFLIDPQGKIIATDLRGEDLERQLAEVLN